jgi:hypothetical protein
MDRSRGVEYAAQTGFDQRLEAREQIIIHAWFVNTLKVRIISEFMLIQYQRSPACTADSG